VSRIYWDTMLFVYLLERKQEFAHRVEAIHSRMVERNHGICTSILTIGEVLAGPSKRGATELAADIRKAFLNPRIEILPFNWETAERYAEIRGAHRVSTADAIHLASAAQAGVTLFLTNDRDLHNLVIPGIDFIAGLDVNLF
jgi:predicted nucleic acid-binding protein